MNDRQTKVIRNWPQLLWTFAKAECLSILAWSALGALGAGLLRLLLLDHTFEKFLTTTYLPPPSHFDEVRLYFPYLLTIALAILAALAIHLPEIIARGFRSWTAGVASGLSFLPFASTLIILAVLRNTTAHKLLIDLAVIGASFVLSFLLCLNSRINNERALDERDLQVPHTSRSAIRTEPQEPDEPIQTWSEDALGRAAIVDSISIKLLISKSPVVALFGEFGSGKTSLLNLLREHLEKQAIVVSFSTWLPGSEKTLTSYLLADLATECQKQYVVPGLRKGARRFANVLSHSVPFLKILSALAGPETQRDDIESLKAALRRLPKRVIVLLDEIDRMQRAEVLALLKVIRGISSVPNLSFVCASNRETLVETVKGEFDDKSNLYFDKFFPVSFQIPKPDEEALRHAGVDRLVAEFRRRGWFEEESQSESVRKQIDSLWQEKIAPFCPNLRAIGLLANDVGAAAAPLRREVHPVDLTLIELLHRFKPSVYEVVERNSVSLTGGESPSRGGSFRLDNEEERLKKKLLDDLQRVAGGDEQLKQVKGVLDELFPEFRQIDGRAWAARPRAEDSKESEKRIYNPGMFPAYFRYEVPRAMFSSVELDALLRRIDNAPSDQDRRREFMEELNSMTKGDLRRDDFLRKLSNAVKWMPPNVREFLALTVMEAADKYVYDSLLAGAAEAGHVLRIVIEVTEMLPVPERTALLSQCIAAATDDTMALRILTILTSKQSGTELGVSFAQLYPAFIKRMRQRYGRNVDAVKMDLTASDAWAFNLWGSSTIKGDPVTIDPEDRAIQYDFWLRHIGNSRSRLARAFQGFFMPFGIYTEDPTLAVQNKIPLKELKRLHDELPNDEPLTEVEQKSLGRLQRLLNGEFKNGIQPEQWDGPPKNSDNGPA